MFFEMDDGNDTADRIIHEHHSTGLVENDNPRQLSHIDDFGQGIHGIIVISFFV